MRNAQQSNKLLAVYLDISIPRQIGGKGKDEGSTCYTGRCKL